MYNHAKCEIVHGGSAGVMTSPLQAVLLTILEGLEAAVRLYVRDIVIWTDATNAVKALLGLLVSTMEVENVVEDIKGITKMFASDCVVKVHRDSITLKHRLG